MRFSTFLAGFMAVCAVSAIPTSIFLPVGNLPSQPTTSTLVLKDLDTLNTAITDLGTAVQNIINFKKTNIGNGVTLLTAVLEKTIAYQIATQTARLNAQGIAGTFSLDDSVAVINQLKNVIYPILKIATDLLNTAKTVGALGTNTSIAGSPVNILSPLGLTNYLELIKTDTAGFTTALLSYIDPTLQPNATAVTNNMNNLLNVTYDFYTT
ncbi:uncharacterized protein ColSpa_03738 [Colletotrichum spaethianum]|uniref:Cell wall galactomannoprotein n=1 Tax=Colletotrichum spaethianum TaxID=700344 RepID=A0AA37LG78_9PEZI|nr:uncharacterized protein ColSpa_03738 [Colletotrichum spaethianum]GKT43557.1 hypothetical protein ColSpa_03738 [Colletotrichum spaethianum]